jgi:hypothetical protein
MRNPYINNNIFSTNYVTPGHNIRNNISLNQSLFSGRSSFNNSDDRDLMFAIQESKRLYEETLKNKQEEEEQRKKLSVDLSVNSLSNNENNPIANKNSRKRLNPYQEEDKETNLNSKRNKQINNDK